MTTKTKPPVGAGGSESKTHSGHANHSNADSQSQCACLDSERAILGAILEDDDDIMPDVIASGLASSDFYYSGHRRVFDAMVEQWQQQNVD